MHARSRALPLVIATVSALFLSSCGTVEAFNPFAPRSRADTEIQVRVENQNFGDATVYAIRGGQRLRLGNVIGKSDEDFTLRWDFSLPLEFRIDIIGGLSCTIRPMTVDPGDNVQVRIPTELSAQACFAVKGR